MSVTNEQVEHLCLTIDRAANQIGKEGAYGMGAIEAVAFEIKGVANAINNLADAVREHAQSNV